MSNSHNSQFLHDQISTSDFGFPIGVLLENGWLYPGNFGFSPLVFLQKMIDCIPEKFKNNPYPPVYVSANMCVSHSGRCFGVSSHVWLRLETVVCNPHYWSRFWITATFLHHWSDFRITDLDFGCLTPTFLHHWCDFSNIYALRNKHAWDCMSVYQRLFHPKAEI